MFSGLKYYFRKLIVTSRDAIFLTDERSAAQLHALLPVVSLATCTAALQWRNSGLGVAQLVHTR